MIQLSAACLSFRLRAATVGLLVFSSLVFSTANSWIPNNQGGSQPAKQDPDPVASQSRPAESRPGGAARRGGRTRRPERPASNTILAIEHVRVLRPGQPALEDVNILVRGRRIAAIGRKITIPDNAKRIDATGQTLTAGWIDARGTTPLHRVAIDDGTQNAAQKATDGIDWMDPEGRVRDALQRGITSCYVSAGRGLLSGMGVLVRMRPGERDLEKLEFENSDAMSLVLGSARNEPAIARLSQTTNLRKALRDAQKYRETVEQYEEDLQKFLEDKKKGLKPVVRTADEEKATTPDEGSRPPIPVPRGRRPPRTPEEFDLLAISRSLGIMPVVEDREGGFILDENALEAVEEKDRCGCGGPGPHSSHPPGDQIPDFVFQNPTKDPAKPDAKGTARPKKPDFNPATESLLPALRREVPVRIEARRVDEIRAAIALGVEFKLRLIIEGADEAALMIDEIAKAEFPIILAPIKGPDELPGRERSIALAKLLADKGIPFAIGTGRNYYGTAWLRAQVALAVAGGLSRDLALAAVTTKAAELIGISDELGAVEVGKIADLSVFDGDPMNPSSNVKMVVIDGEVVYER
ncbi:MAG: amidohydrolase family protein [Planctomycetota bacterium]